MRGLIFGLIVPVAAALFGGHSHSKAAPAVRVGTPIVIRSDADLQSWATDGNGSTSKPYVIGPLAINNVNGVAVTVDGANLTKSFILSNLTIAGNGVNTTYGIVLNGINPTGTQTIVAKVQGIQTSIQTCNVGILVEQSSWVVLDGGGASVKGPGVGETGAGTINKNALGAIDIENSSHITVTGWQLSTNGPSVNPDWVTLDPSTDKWAVGGVRCFGVRYSTIDHNSANNCTDISYSLFNSNHNTVSNNTADYPYTMNYLVTDGSSYNTLSGNEGSTGDFIGLMVADPLPGTWTLAAYGPSHDNSIVGNVIHSNGPTGNELNPVSVVPAFLGGIVVLNGTYNNTIKNNQTWASFGTDLAWAQAVPNSNTPIGVSTYPPTLHGNVTASEGGGGVSNLNGNVWTGNTYKTIDAVLPAQ